MRYLKRTKSSSSAALTVLYLVEIMLWNDSGGAPAAAY